MHASTVLFYIFSAVLSNILQIADQHNAQQYIPTIVHTIFTMIFIKQNNLRIGCQNRSIALQKFCLLYCEMNDIHHSWDYIIVRYSGHSLITTFAIFATATFSIFATVTSRRVILL